MLYAFVLFLLESPEALLTREKIDVNIIIGFNNDEGSVVTNAVKGRTSNPIYCTI